VGGEWEILTDFFALRMRKYTENFDFERYEGGEGGKISRKRPCNAVRNL